MKNLQILHITPWYPTPQKIYAGIFVQRHIQSLSGQLTSKVFHINFDDHVKSWFPKFKFSSKNSSDPLMPSKDVLHIQSFPTSWWLREFFCFLVNWWYLTFKAKEIEVVNFYIAYRQQNNWQVFIPPFAYCTDNAAMIAITGYYKYLAGDLSNQGVSASARYPL